VVGLVGFGVSRYKTMSCRSSSLTKKKNMRRNPT
jgi:hypothetical protein